MRKSIFWAVLAFGLLVLALTLPAISQVSYDTITATVNDPQAHPYANANLIANLVDKFGNPVSSATTPNGSLYNAKPIQATLDATGSFSVGLVPNGTLSNPTGTQWRIMISSPVDRAIVSYSPQWDIQYILTVTANVDLSSQLSALARPVAFFNLKTNQSTIAGGLITGIIAGAGLSGGGSSGNISLACGISAVSMIGCVKPDGVTLSVAPDGTLSVISSPSSSVSVNGSVVSNPNFNGTTPTPDAAYIANLFKVSGSNIISETPYGTNSTPGVLRCDGTTTNCSGGVVTAGSGVIAASYPANTRIFAFTDSRGSIAGNDTHACAFTGGNTVTGVVASGGTLTVTYSTAGSQSAGDDLTLYGFAGGDAILNGVEGVIGSSGLTSSTFLITGTSVPNGTYGAGFYGCTYNSTTRIATSPLLPSSSDVKMNAPTNATMAIMNSNYAAMVHPYSPAVTGKAGILIVEAGVGDFLFGSGVLATDTASCESGMQTLWATAHADGWQVYQETVIPYNPFASGATNAVVGPATVNTWLRGQARGTANISTGKYYDQLIMTASDLSYPLDDNVFIQSSPAYHLNDYGNALRFGRLNAALLTRGTFPTGQLGRIITDSNTNNTALNLNDTAYLDTPNTWTNTQYFADWRVLDSLSGNTSTEKFASIQYDTNGPKMYFRPGNLGGTVSGTFYQFPGSGETVRNVNPKDVVDCYNQTAGSTSAAPTVCTSIDGTTSTQIDVSIPGSPNAIGGDFGVRNLKVTGTCTGCGSGSSGLSGMTAGQVPIAATATTVTSSKALAGSGAGIVTGPTTSTNNDCASFSGTTGQIQDSGSPCSGGSAFITSLTTTGSSGAATVASGVLNIPIYSGGGSSSYPTWAFDDMIGGCCVGMTNANSGSGAGYGTETAGTGFGYVQGIAKVFSSNTNNDWSTLFYGNGSSAPTVVLSNTSGSFSFAARVWASSDAHEINKVILGTSMYSAPNPTLEFGFACSSGTFGNNDWWVETNGSSTGAVDTGLGCVGQWHQLEIKVVNGAITYYADGTSITTGTVASASTWMAGFVAWTTSSGSSAGTTLDIDWTARLNQSGVTLQ